MAIEATDEIKATRSQQRVLWNTANNFLGKFIALGAGFFLTPFILRQLGATTYGLWALIGSLVAYGSLLDLGIGNAVTKYTAEYTARGEDDRTRRLIATALRLYSLLGFIVVAATIALAPFVPRLLRVPLDQRPTAAWLVILAGLVTGIALPCSTTGAVLRGLQRYDTLNVIYITGTCLSVIATIGVLLLDGGVLGMVAVGIPVTVIMQAISIAILVRVRPGLRFGWRDADRSLVRPIMSFSAWLFLVDVAGRVQTKTDELVIGIFLPISAVTPYAIANRLSGLGQIVANQFLKVLLPLASQLHAENDTARLRALYITSTRLALALFLPMGCILFTLGQSIITAWVGPAYAGSVPIVAILTLASLFDITMWTAGSILPAMARHQPLAISALCSAGLNLGLSIALVQRFGVVGVALGTLIPTAIECIGFVLPYTMRVMGVGIAEALKEIFLPAFLPAIPTALVLALLRETDPASLLSVAALSTLGLGIYIIAYLCVGASATERRAYHNVVRSLLRLVRK